MTKAYFGDGVYASFDGHSITLMANGAGCDATDRIHLEPAMLDAMVAWARNGYRDHQSGRTFEIDHRITALRDKMEHDPECGL